MRFPAFENLRRPRHERPGRASTARGRGHVLPANQGCGQARYGAELLSNPDISIADIANAPVSPKRRLSVRRSRSGQTSARRSSGRNTRARIAASSRPRTHRIPRSSLRSSISEDTGLAHVYYGIAVQPQGTQNFLGVLSDPGGFPTGRRATEPGGRRGLHHAIDVEKGPRAILCGCRGASAKFRTGAKQVSVPSSNSHQSWRERARNIACN